MTFFAGFVIGAACGIAGTLLLLSIVILEENLPK